MGLLFEVHDNNDDGTLSNSVHRFVLAVVAVEVLNSNTQVASYPFGIWN